MTLETSPSQSLRGSRGPLNNFLCNFLKIIIRHNVYVRASYICALYMYKMYLLHFHFLAFFFYFSISRASMHLCSFQCIFQCSSKDRLESFICRFGPHSSVQRSQCNLSTCLCRGPEDSLWCH